MDRYVIKDGKVEWRFNEDGYEWIMDWFGKYDYKVRYNEFNRMVDDIEGRDE